MVVAVLLRESHLMKKANHGSPCSYSQLVRDASKNESILNKSTNRSSSFHKSIVKLVTRGLQELARIKSSSYTAASDVPKGYLAVYVGNQERQAQRFIVRTQHLNHPIFKVLLNKCEEEFGFCHKGPLLIPCQVDLFHLLLWHIENNDMVLDASQAQELVDLYLLSLANLDTARRDISKAAMTHDTDMHGKSQVYFQ